MLLIGWDQFGKRNGRSPLLSVHFFSFLPRTELRIAILLVVLCCMALLLLLLLLLLVQCCIAILLVLLLVQFFSFPLTTYPALHMKFPYFTFPYITFPNTTLHFCAIFALFPPLTDCSHYLYFNTLHYFALHMTFLTLHLLTPHYISVQFLHFSLLSLTAPSVAFDQGSRQ